MESEASYMWTLSSLTCAYLDLAIAFLSLCASAVVFLSLKFLGICGLRLPYPCNWLFGIAPNDIQNLQRLLSDVATEKVSNVKLSVKEKYHYNAQNIHLNLRLIGEREDVHSHNGHTLVEMEVEAPSSSASDVGMSSNADRIEFMPRSGLEMNGKVVKKYRRRRSVDHCRLFSFSRYDPQYVELQDDQQCPSIDDKRNEMSEDSQELFNSGTDACSNVTGFGQRDSFKLDENVFPDDDEQSENDSSCEELNGHVQVDQLYNVNDKSAVRLLEKALEEEKAARAALYLELEKERNAVATAADEAMAMISRLQEEKASIEMEARQYKRIIEEKSAYEADEMEILKEILVRRETEKHFLEKEVEAYRQMIYLGNEQFAGKDEHIAENEKNLFDFSPDLSEEDPVLMLSQICASAEKKVMKESKSSDDECLRHNSEDSYEEIECFSNLSSDKEHHVYDVHVIADGSSLCNKGNKNKEKLLSANANVKSNLKIDNEKLNLDNNGVEWLGGRLKTVQDGREKFTLSLQSREREKVQLKLLEDIACQLQEIRQLTVSEGRDYKESTMSVAALPLHPVSSRPEGRTH